MYNSTCLKLEYSVSFPHGPQHSASIIMTKQKRFTVQEKCYIVSSFQMFTSKKNRVGKIRLGLMNKFPDRKVPSKASIFRLVKKYETNFTVENLHKGHSGRSRSVRTREVVEEVEQISAADREVPYDRIVNTCRRNILNLTRSTWCRILKHDLKLTCYR